ncbi:hypothetical protein NBO_425g0001 [Nosema bombycis CQ1]|uniref:Uncharacterized protein n=1 Tax=Nosema bombycis (strain CQ1 / CVCC 102059) TaxID=578461 RepID=R0KQK9_NOSB1|nr:hypothetical protein NBO_425g0001 [Nosema bombycis CQ1]|eukprot:EOB12492.1 hypothetical protein NBO_425g0001 [Nosema bombycis CQ1]
MYFIKVYLHCVVYALIWPNLCEIRAMHNCIELDSSDVHSYKLSFLQCLVF